MKGKINIFILLALATFESFAGGLPRRAAMYQPQSRAAAGYVDTTPRISPACARAVREAYGRRDHNRPADRDRGPELPRRAVSVDRACL